MRNNVSYAYAGFGVRFCAWLVDSALMLIPLAILSGVRFSFNLSDPYGILSRAVLFRYSLFDIILYLVPVLYFTVMTYAGGATIGKMMFKLKVVSADSDRLTFWTVVVRELFGRYLSTATFLIGYLMAIPDREKRTLHDRLSYTRVVYNVEPLAARPVPPSASASAEDDDFPDFKPVEPATPVKTETPVETATPVETETPVEAETPVETETPVEAERPVETETPVETATPVETETPVEAETPTPVTLKKSDDAT